MQEIRRKLNVIAKMDVPLLLQGESGTGKDLFAQLIHLASERAGKPLVKVNCPALPSSLLEAELFGYERGAFDGASNGKHGRIEKADGGTLVLDEVESLEIGGQVKLLQLLQDGTFLPVGGNELRSVSTRVICIAKEDLRRKVGDGTFRQDFLYRINAVTINLPPLRHRLDDLPELIDYFSRQHAQGVGMKPRQVSKGLLGLMRGYDWPGNIRELDNLIRSYTMVGDEERLAAELTPPVASAHEITAQIDVSKPLSLKKITRHATRDLERQIIMKVLQANGWNRQKTARSLQISYRSLFYKLSGLQHPDGETNGATAAEPGVDAAGKTC